MEIESRNIFNFELNESRSVSLVPIEAFEYYFFINEVDNLAIIESYSPDLDVYEDLKKNNLGLAELYVASKLLFGESTTVYDSYKGSFGYPFLLVLKRAEKRFIYVMLFDDYSGVPNFSFRRIIVNDDIEYEERDLHTYVEPIKNELSGKNINLLVHKFMMFLIGTYKGVSLKKEYKHKSFIRYSEKALLIYGFVLGKSFHRHYNNYDDFWEEINSVKKVIKKMKIKFNVTKENKSIDYYKENLIEIETGENEYINFGIQDNEIVLEYEHQVTMQEEFLGIIFKEFNEMESKVIKIIAGTKEDIISKKILDENLMILDIGFSNKAKSCGLIINDDFHEELTFSDAKKKIIEFIKNNNKLTINLVIEASLSITFDKKGNPKGRKIEKEESKTRYWYYGAASTVTLATMELIKAISILRIDATVRLFEGFISFKEKDSKNNKNGHLNDAQLLKNTIENPKEGSVIEENNNKMSDSDVLKSSFDVMGLNVGVPAVIIGR